MTLKIRAEGTVKLENPSMTMDEAEAKLKALGNTILSRDDDARTFKIMDTEKEQTFTEDTEVPDDHPFAVAARAYKPHPAGS